MPYTSNFFKSSLGYEGKVLTQYKYQLERQNQLLDKIRLILPDHLANHALYCVISNHKVSLYTDSATWSSQLRFYQQKILQSLRSSNYKHIASLQIKIIPKVSEQKPEKTIRTPSSDTIDLILNQAESQKDEKLKAALLRLGTTFKNRSHVRNGNQAG